MSRSAAGAFLAAWVSLAAGAAGPAFADDGVAAPAAATAPAAPVVEVVRDGGVAEAWREEGSGFATYGPDGEAVVPTAEQQALQALANAYDVEFVDLTGPEPGRVPADTIDRYALARAVAAEALGEARSGATTGTTVYTHALAYTSDGHAWELRLCFECRRYALRRDGVDAIAPGDGIRSALQSRPGFRARRVAVHHQPDDVRAQLRRRRRHAGRRRLPG